MASSFRLLTWSAFTMSFRGAIILKMHASCEMDAKHICIRRIFPMCQIRACDAPVEQPESSHSTLMEAPPVPSLPITDWLRPHLGSPSTLRSHTKALGFKVWGHGSYCGNRTLFSIGTQQPPLPGYSVSRSLPISVGPSQQLTDSML